MYAELNAKREARMFHRINIIVACVFAFAMLSYFAFEVVRPLPADAKGISHHAAHHSTRHHRR